MQFLKQDSLLCDSKDNIDGNRIKIPSNAPWASLLAYSRAVRVGNVIVVSGTLPVDSVGNTVGGDDGYQQARQIIRVIESALEEAGASLRDVIRLRIYLRDYEDLEDVARAQSEAFATIRPVCTVLQTKLVRPEFRVQIDAEAFVDEQCSTKSS